MTFRRDSKMTLRSPKSRAIEIPSRAASASTHRAEHTFFFYSQVLQNGHRQSFPEHSKTLSSTRQQAVLHQNLL
ncbi:hypothetical protein GBA52_028849 [Prunus armeniaca]|nr:hypothetical protein GBA52_028849 [Prunus armeniaca]